MSEESEIKELFTEVCVYSGVFHNPFRNEFYYS